jgi:hypothetical protein
MTSATLLPIGGLGRCEPMRIHTIPEWGGRWVTVTWLSRRAKLAKINFVRLKDENAGAFRPVTSAHSGACEPVERVGRGSLGHAGLLLRARGSVSADREAPPGGASGVQARAVVRRSLYTR